MQMVKGFTSWFSKQNLLGKLVIGCSSFLVVCCLCGWLSIMLTPSPSPSEEKNTIVVEVSITPTTAKSAKTRITPKPPKSSPSSTASTKTLTTLTSIPDAITATNAPETPSPIPGTLTPTKTPKPPTAIPTATKKSNQYIYLFEVADLVFLDHDIYRGNGSGLKVYMGEQKLFIFEIMGGGDCPSMPSGQGYLVRYPDTGNLEWKDRSAMEASELFITDDPFELYARDWQLYYDCP